MLKSGCGQFVHCSIFIKLDILIVIFIIFKDLEESLVKCFSPLSWNTRILAAYNKIIWQKYKLISNLILNHYQYQLMMKKKPSTIQYLNLGPSIYRFIAVPLNANESPGKEQNRKSSVQS